MEKSQHLYNLFNKFGHSLINMQKRRDYNDLMVKAIQMHVPRRMVLGPKVWVQTSGSAWLRLSSLYGLLKGEFMALLVAVCTQLSPLASHHLSA